MIALLKMHVIHWAGFAMRLLNFYLGNLGVMAHHIQRPVPELRLQSEHIPAGAQIGDRKGMMEFVWIGLLNSSPISQPVNQNPQAIDVEGPVGMTDEQRRQRIIPILPACQVAPDGLAGNLAQIYRAPHPQSHGESPPDRFSDQYPRLTTSTVHSRTVRCPAGSAR